VCVCVVGGGYLPVNCSVMLMRCEGGTCDLDTERVM
jgi:hypothetical protein